LLLNYAEGKLLPITPEANINISMEYNTQQKRLILPEYGRHIQNMVDHCLTIADRDERTRCAQTIISTMGNLFPHLRDISDFKHILWDHLAIMSNFDLDIDYPYEIIKKENLYTKPDPIPYSSSRQIRYMHYGKTLQLLIGKAMTYEDGEEKDQLVAMIANHMKRCFASFNKEGVDDRKIFDDIRELSGGKIDVSEEDLQLAEIKDIAPPAPSKSNGKSKKSGR
jgi:hypothetical protein